MPESKFISFMIFQKLADYPEIRILLKKHIMFTIKILSTFLRNVHFLM